MFKKVVLGALALIVLVVVVVGFSGCSSYNGLVTASQAVDRDWAQVQNVYQRRADLVPNLVSTVSGSANFEKSTLESVVKARASATSVNVSTTAPTDPAQFQQFEKAQNQLGQSLSRLLAVVENYPDLKSSQNFLALQVQLEGTENRISTERERFNSTVAAYNGKAQRFPGVIWARLFGFNAKPYFNATPEAQTVPKVDFNFSTTPATLPSR